MNLSRRTFLRSSLAGGAAVAAGAAATIPFLPTRARHFTGSIVGANSALGHALREGKLPPPTETAETGIVIVGGGIGGLAAARHLQRAGFLDFLLLELEARPGGNAHSGQNAVSAFPWGAHYVPIPGADAVEVTELFEDLGVIQGRDSAGLAVYREEYLCADPMERLFIHGRWQEGLVPQLGVSESDQPTIAAFFAEMQRLKSVRGSDGRRAFTIPLDESSRDEEFRHLDTLTMAEYLRGNNWYECAPLRWYVNYCCRDDYGAGLEKISAWAGVHYFAARDSVAANAPGYAVVTWPEGNGWFVRHLAAAAAGRIRSSCPVWNVESDGDRFLVDFYDASTQKTTRLRAQGVVWAAPHFVAQRAIRALRDQPPLPPLPAYSPWLVANLTLDALPTGHGMDLAWDNVFYRDDSLGYVVATHQDLHPFPARTVLTYYQPLDDEEPAAARRTAFARSYEEWCQSILADLARAHPDLSRHLRNLDVWLWGHAMIRPVPGFIWGPGRARMQQPLGNLVFAHSDLGGISIFEEAYTRGVRAARGLLENLGHSTRT